MVVHVQEGVFCEWELVAAWTPDAGLEGCDGGGFHAGPQEGEFAMKELAVLADG